jgi:hypothetical protein
VEPRTRRPQSTGRIASSSRSKPDISSDASKYLEDKMSLARIALLFAATAVALTLFVGPGAQPAHAGLNRALKCSFHKQRTALRRAEAVLECQREALRMNAPIDPACVDAAENRFHAVFEKIEKQGGCAIEGDSPIVEEIVDRFTRLLQIQLQGSCTDLGEACNAGAAPCCTGLVCRGQIGQTPACVP